MNDTLLLAQLIKNGELSAGGSSGADQAIIIDDSFMYAFNAIKGYNTYEGYQDLGSNAYSFRAGRRLDPMEEGYDYVFNINGEFVQYFLQIQQDEEVNPLKRIIIKAQDSSEALPILLDRFYLEYRYGNYYICCHISFSALSNTSNGGWYGTFDGNLRFKATPGEDLPNVEVILDAEFGVNNLQYLAVE